MSRCASSPTRATGTRLNTGSLWVNRVFLQTRIGKINLTTGATSPRAHFPLRRRPSRARRRKLSSSSPLDLKGSRQWTGSEACVDGNEISTNCVSGLTSSLPEPMKPPDESWRLFIAIELPSSVRRNVQDHINQLRQAVPEARASWIREENLHLTIKFLGDTPVTNVEALSQAIQRAGH